MRRLNGCEWWQFRGGRMYGGGGRFRQLGPVTFDWFRWDAEEYWIEAHCLNWCFLRLRLPIKTSVVRREETTCPNPPPS